MLATASFGKNTKELLLQNGKKNVFTMAEQVEQFSSIYSVLVAVKGQASAEAFLSKSLFFISTGSNDIFAYYLSKSTAPKKDFLATLELLYDSYLRVRFLQQ